MARIWPFNFPPHMAVKDLEARDVYELIIRGVSEGQQEAQSDALRKRMVPSTSADMVRAGLEDKRTLMGG